MGDHTGDDQAGDGQAGDDGAAGPPRGMAEAIGAIQDLRMEVVALQARLEILVAAIGLLFERANIAPERLLAAADAEDRALIAAEADGNGMAAIRCGERAILHRDMGAYHYPAPPDGAGRRVSVIADGTLGAGKAGQKPFGLDHHPACLLSPPSQERRDLSHIKGIDGHLSRRLGWHRRAPQIRPQDVTGNAGRRLDPLDQLGRYDPAAPHPLAHRGRTAPSGSNNVKLPHAVLSQNGAQVLHASL